MTRLVTIWMRLAGVSTGLVLLALLLPVVSGCQGRPSDKPPIHLVQDMDQQPRYDPQSESRFFADSLTMRPLVAGTVPRGGLKDDPEYYTGRDASGRLITRIPATIDMVALKRGQKEYDIYCSPCHGRVGDGQGIMIRYNYVPPPTFHDDRLRSIEDGHMFDVITNGIRNMPAYAHQIPVSDRWAIVAYLRALQRSQSATFEDIPEAMRDRVQ
jgi:mono/diheme cytochrome c family protein